RVAPTGREAPVAAMAHRARTDSTPCFSLQRGAVTSIMVGNPRRPPMHILCPHCANPIQVVKLIPREELSCPSCGSGFHLKTESTRTGPLVVHQLLGRYSTKAEWQNLRRGTRARG